MKRTSKLVAVVLLFCSSLAAQPENPSDFLASIPFPPRSTEEVLRRCPDTSDTLVRRWKVKLEQIAAKERKSFEADSLAESNPRRRPQVPLEGERVEFDSLRKEIGKEQDSLSARLHRLMTAGTRQLIREIRRIGEELDKDITGCPKVGLRQIYDSLCVALAEVKAAESRLLATDAYLAETHSRWNAIVSPLETHLRSAESRMRKLRSRTENSHLRPQLARFRLEAWQTMTPILDTVDAVTRLAAQFTR